MHVGGRWGVGGLLRVNSRCPAPLAARCVLHPGVRGVCSTGICSQWQNSHFQAGVLCGDGGGVGLNEFDRSPNLQTDGSQGAKGSLSVFVLSGCFEGHALTIIWTFRKLPPDSGK